MWNLVEKPFTRHPIDGRLIFLTCQKVSNSLIQFERSYSVLNGVRTHWLYVYLFIWMRVRTNIFRSTLKRGTFMEHSDLWKGAFRAPKSPKRGSKVAGRWSLAETWVECLPVETVVTRRARNYIRFHILPMFLARRPHSRLVRASRRTSLNRVVEKRRKNEDKRTGYSICNHM